MERWSDGAVSDQRLPRVAQSPDRPIARSPDHSIAQSLSCFLENEHSAGKIECRSSNIRPIQ